MLCEILPRTLCSFPSLDEGLLREMRKSVDAGFKAFVRAYGDPLDAALQPLQWFLNALQDLFVSAPWTVFLLILTLLVYAASRSLTIALGTLLSMVLIGLVGLW